MLCDGLTTITFVIPFFVRYARFCEFIQPHYSHTRRMSGKRAANAALDDPAQGRLWAVLAWVLYQWTRVAAPHPNSAQHWPVFIAADF
jgi:hypothetical protein